MEQKPVRRIHLKEFKTISRAISTYEDFNLQSENCHGKPSHMDVGGTLL